MASTFPKTNKWGYIKKNNIDKFNDTWTTFFWTKRKESLEIRGLSHFAEILLHQSMVMDELRERSRGWGRN